MPAGTVSAIYPLLTIYASLERQFTTAWTESNFLQIVLPGKIPPADFKDEFFLLCSWNFSEISWLAGMNNLHAVGLLAHGHKLI